MLLKAAKLVEQSIYYLMAAFLAFITGLVITLVLLRYVFGTGIWGANELARLLFAYTTALGAAVITHSKGHIKVDFFVQMLPEKMRLLLEAIKYLLMGGMFLLILYYGAIWVRKTGNFKIESLGIPQWTFQISLLISGVLGFVYCILNVLTACKQEQIKTKVEAVD